MLERWMIVASPTTQDPRRHTLQVKAEMADLQAIVRRFGAMCGRPQKRKGDSQFNYSVYLHRATSDALERVEDLLTRMSPDGRRAAGENGSSSAAGVGGSAAAGAANAPGTAAAENGPAAAGAPESSASGGSEPPLPVLRPLEANRGEAPPPLPAISPPPAAQAGPVPGWTPPGETAGADDALPAGAENVLPAAGPGPSPAEAPSIGGAPGGPVAAESRPADAPSAGAPAPAATPGPQASPAVARRPEEPLWGALLALDSKKTIDSLIVGPFNRFAHAASTAVISNPGSMYNPLFLYGAPGVGKSHLLTAISRAIQDAKAGDAVFFTTGPRLSRAARLAVAEGKMEELQARIVQCRALMIDDVHLLAMTDEIQPALASILANCFKAAKHVGMTSVYPPRALGSLEEALKFQISSGWSVEMKVPVADTQRLIVQRAISEGAYPGNAQDERAFLDGIGAGFAELGAWLKRLGALSRLSAAAGAPSGLADLIPALFAPLAAAGQELSSEEARASGAALPPCATSAAPEAKRLAVFFPRGAEDHAALMTARFLDVARRHGAELPVRPAASEAYDPDQLYGVPFVIADICDRAAADAALVLGPAGGSGLGQRQAELTHALARILAAVRVPVGWVPFDRLQEDAAVFRALLDVYPAWNPEAGPP